MAKPKANRMLRTKEKARRPKKQWGRIVNRLVLILVVVGFVYGINALGERLDAIPVDRVVFAGDVERASREALVERVSGQLSVGYLGLDLTAIQSELEKEPWVYHATVERRWPRELKITIVEETPIAVWGDGGLLNHRAEVFVPRSENRSTDIDALPVLDGPAGSELEMMRQYRLMSQLLGDENLGLKYLKMSARGSLTITLNDGVELVLGRDEVLEKLRRFLVVYHRELASQFARVKRVDTRYINGLAVSWRKELPQEQGES
jgi:cell division protein FtsQ